MSYKEDICRWSGLSGIEVNHILNLLDKKNIDWQVIDWQTLGEEARDFGNRYEVIWSKLADEYGIEKPVIESQLGQKIEEYEAGEMEFLHGTKEGVKEILQRIYKDPSISKKQKEDMKQALKEETSAYFATLIALYNGEEKNLAKRWLGEEVIAPTPEDVKLLIDKPIFSVLSKRGWIKAIDGVYLKQPMRSTKFVKLIPECKLVHSEERGEPGRVAVYRKTKPKETEDIEVVSVKPHEEVFRVHLPALEPISPMAKEMLVKPVETPPVSKKDLYTKAEKLACEYSYGDTKKMMQDNQLYTGGTKVKMFIKLIETGAI